MLGEVNRIKFSVVLIQTLRWVLVVCVISHTLSILELRSNQRSFHPPPAVSGRDGVTVTPQILVALMTEIRVSLWGWLSGKNLKLLLLFPSPRLIIQQLPGGELHIVLQFLHSLRNFMTLVTYPQGKVFSKEAWKLLRGLTVPSITPEIRLEKDIFF